MNPEDEITAAPVRMEAEASDYAVVTQVSGDYAEHHHSYVRGWEYLGAVGVSESDINFVDTEYVRETGDDDAADPVRRAVESLKMPLAQRNIVILAGPPGTGRYTTALRVLRDVGVAGKNIRSLILDWDRPRTAQIPHTPQHGFILDLSVYENLPRDFYQGLSDYQQAAARDGVYLAILATPGIWPESLSIPVVECAGPPAVEVAKAHVRYLAHDRESWLNDLSEQLGNTTSPEDAVRLARIIANPAIQNTADAKDEFLNWNIHLSNWFKKNNKAEDLRNRALLIAAALLEGLPAQIVMDSADKLLQKVGVTSLTGGALAGPDLKARLDDIEAVPIDGDRISLSKKKHALHEAVLVHVWQQRPQLRSVLLEWASEISAPNGIAVKHLPRIAEAVTRLAAGPGGGTVLRVVIKWTETDSKKHRRLAVGVLDKMACHPAIGAAVRKSLYDWAGQKGTSEKLAEAIAKVCAGDFGLMYPRVALTRLRLLASREDQRAADAVAEATRALACAPDRRALILAEIVGWAENDDSAMRQAGTTAFLSLTDLTGEDAIAPSLAREFGANSDTAPEDQLFVRGWRAALRHDVTADKAQTSLTAWLDAADAPDDQVISVTQAVLTGNLGRKGVAELLVGSDTSTDTGRKRRKALIDDSWAWSRLPLKKSLGRRRNRP